MGSLKVFLTGTKKGSNESVINFEEFNSEFENSDVAFIALMAPWCGHCNNLLDNLKPVVDKLKYEKTDKKVVVGAFHGNPRSPDEGEDEFPKLHNNIDTNVLGFPTIRLYKNGVFEKNLGDVLDRSEEGLEKCIRDLMGLAKTLIFTSELEGLPNAVIEAMSLGLPILAQNKSSMPELVKENNGWLVDSDNLDLWIDHVKIIHSTSETEMDQLRKTSRQQTVGLFSWHKYAANHIELYNSLI